MRYKITVDGKIFYANMIRNDITNETSKHLPMKTDYTRYTDHEYYTKLPFPTSDLSCKKETLAHKNGIWYFGGWNAFTILFGDCDTSPFEVVKLGEIEEIYSRYNDDKEPHNSSGMQIYNQLLIHKKDHHLLVIIRYFGGIKLGASNLLRAYLNTV